MAAVRAGQGLAPGRPSRRPGGLGAGAARRRGGGGLSRSFGQVRLGGGRPAAAGPGRGRAPGPHSRAAGAGAGRAWSASRSRRPWPLRGDRNAAGSEGAGRPWERAAVLGKRCRVRPRKRLRPGTGCGGARGPSRPVTHDLCPRARCSPGWPRRPPPPGALGSGGFPVRRLSALRPPLGHGAPCVPCRMASFPAGRGASCLRAPSPGSCRVTKLSRGQVPVSHSVTQTAATRR